MVVRVDSNPRRDPNVVRKHPAPISTLAAFDMASRTAALSRYLAALDSPPAAPGNASVPTAPDLASRISVSSSQDPNEIETSFANGNSDLFNGHKVVAMPSLGGKSVREVVSSREPPAPTVVRRSVTPGQQRSRSAGRAPQGKTSRDIVQDVYDRMGVSREDLGGDADKFQVRYRAAAALSANVEMPARGRSLDVSTDGQRRARSLSRGRSVTGRWPPTRDQDEREQRATRDSAPDRTTTSISTDARVDNAPTSRHQVVHQQAKQSLVAAVDDANRINRASTVSAGSIAPSKKPSTTRKAPEPISLQPSDDQSEDPAVPGLPDGISNLSVKDRVTALTGGKSNRNFPKRSIPVQYAKRPPPPKIDIYEEIRKNKEEDTAAPLPAPEPSNIPPSPVAAAAADAAAELVRKNQYGRQHNNARNGSNSNGGKKLDPFQTPNNSKPPIEISGTDDLGGLADSGSVALSSVSADEYMDRSPVSLPAKKEPVNRRWNGVASTHRAVIQSPSSVKSTYSLNADQLDRLVEERMQTHIADLESKMGAQMMRLESYLEERMQTRMDQLEVKIDKIGAMLTNILSHRREL